MIPTRQWCRSDMSTQHLWDWVKTVHPAYLYQGAQGPFGVGIKPPEPFIQFARQFIDSLGYEVKDWQYWVGYHDQHAKKSAGSEIWIHPFPHSHPDICMRTMILYLTEPEWGGELVVYSNDVEYVIPPKVGLCALITGHESHGVRVLRGNTPRVTVIANANVK